MHVLVCVRVCARVYVFHKKKREEDEGKEKRRKRRRTSARAQERESKIIIYGEICAMLEIVDNNIAWYIGRFDATVRPPCHRCDSKIKGI